jgi:hypothetical protein
LHPSSQAGRVSRTFPPLLPLPVPQTPGVAVCESHYSFTLSHTALPYPCRACSLFRASRICSRVRCDVLRAPVRPMSPLIEEVREGSDRNAAEPCLSTFSSSVSAIFHWRPRRRPPGLGFRQCSFTRLRLALATHEIDDFSLRCFWPQHASLPPPFRDSSLSAGISWVRMGSSNNPSTLRYAHSPPPMRRTLASRITRTFLACHSLIPTLLPSDEGSSCPTSWAAPSFVLFLFTTAYYGGSVAMGVATSRRSRICAYQTFSVFRQPRSFPCACHCRLLTAKSVSPSQGEMCYYGVAVSGMLRRMLPFIVGN